VAVGPDVRGHPRPDHHCRRLHVRRGERARLCATCAVHAKPPPPPPTCALCPPACVSLHVHLLAKAAGSSIRLRACAARAGALARAQRRAGGKRMDVRGVPVHACLMFLRTVWSPLFPPYAGIRPSSLARTLWWFCWVFFLQTAYMVQVVRGHLHPGHKGARLHKGGAKGASACVCVRARVYGCVLACATPPPTRAHARTQQHAHAHTCTRTHMHTHTRTARTCGTHLRTRTQTHAPAHIHTREHAGKQGGLWSSVEATLAPKDKDDR